MLLNALAGTLFILSAACSPNLAGAAPGPGTTNTPLLAWTDTAVPCQAIFTPLGFLPGGFLLGRQTIEGQRFSRLQTLDLFTRQVETVYEYSSSEMDWPVLSPDGKLAAVPQTDFSVHLIDLADGAQRARLSGHAGFVSAMVFSPSGDRVYTGSVDTFVRVWDLSGGLIGMFQPDGPDNLPSEITGVGISPDGSQLVTIPVEGWIKVWDATTFKKLGEYEGPIFGSYNGSSARFSPDGRYLAVGLAAGTGAVSLWHVRDGALLWRGGFFGFTFSPDGKIFAHTQTGNVDKFSEQVILSSVDGQIQLETLDEPYHIGIERMFFSPDGKKLVVFRADGETQIWDLAKEQKLLTYKALCP
jgi:WD40 repeat protein